MTDSTEAVADRLELTISIVTFDPDPTQLRTTLESLAEALVPLAPDAVLVTLIDNSPKDEVSALLRSIEFGAPLRLQHGHGNIGFGRGHNLALDRLGEFHLILNPDVQLRSDALTTALSFMRDNPQCGLVTPHAEWPGGRKQYLCKRFPPAFDLLLRGFAPAPFRSLFHDRLSRYEMRDETQDETFWNPPIVSGCFMFFRSEVLRRLGGFDEDYFLYFEDFDLSIRSAQIAKTAYVPMVRIVHEGGHAGRKGWWHIRQFLISAARFYRSHGFRLF